MPFEEVTEDQLDDLAALFAKKYYIHFDKSKFTEMLFGNLTTAEIRFFYAIIAIVQEKEITDWNEIFWIPVKDIRRCMPTFTNIGYEDFTKIVKNLSQYWFSPLRNKRISAGLIRNTSRVDRERKAIGIQLNKELEEYYYKAKKTTKFLLSKEFASLKSVASMKLFELAAVATVDRNDVMIKLEGDELMRYIYSEKNIEAQNKKRIEGLINSINNTGAFTIEFLPFVEDGEIRGSVFKIKKHDI